MVVFGIDPGYAIVGCGKYRSIMKDITPDAARQ